jgi:hypothetical protein
MKKMIVLVVLCAAVTGFAVAGGLDFHLGAGYHSSYIGSLDTDDLTLQTLESMPLGIGGYVGLGWGFGEKKRFAAGAEFAPSWDFSFNPMGISNFAYEARAYAKFEPGRFFTLAGFGGYSGNLVTGLDEIISSPNVVFGARMTLTFLYVEYSAVMRQDWAGIARHGIGAGFAFFK